MTPEQRGKLPKWVQAEIQEIEERAALSWPTEAEPTPALQTNGDRPARNIEGEVWSLYGSATAPVVKAEMINGNGLVVSPGFLSRPHGSYYHTQREALIAGRWRMCRAMARELRRVDAQIAQAEADK
jgi:hypothetical protein